MASKVSGGVCRRGGCSGSPRQGGANLRHVAADPGTGGEDGPQTASARGRAAAAALAETWHALADVCRDLDDEQWRVATDCPGWTVQCQLSHLIGIERELLGEAAPTWPEPLGPHVRNEFAEHNEPWIAARRARPGAAVLAEFVAVTDLRLDRLESLTEAGWAHVGPTIVGEVAYADFMRTRVFDSWVHEQDVRFALGRPGGSGGLASALAIGQVEAAMGFVVGKQAAAPEGSVVRFSVTGPGPDARQFTLAVEGGRARRVTQPDMAAGGGAASGPVTAVSLTMSSLDFVRLGCGRVKPGETAAGVEVGGDAALTKRILEAMNFMF
jgi:uncharacterized protein (TIGR03083 family)